VEPGAGQAAYEKSIDGIVVRNKRYYKAGSLELTGTVGVMPYDSLVNHVMAGGRLAWHIADHYGWELADVQLTFPTITSFTTDTVRDNGISNLQTPQLKLILGTNFLLSPLYGKIRIFSRNVVYYDIYIVAGGGVANVNVLQFASTGKGIAGTQTTLSSSMNPMFDFGFGLKFFVNRAMAIVVDLRDYVVSSTVYNQKALKSNYSVFTGLSFFIPSL